MKFDCKGSIINFVNNIFGQNKKTIKNIFEAIKFAILYLMFKIKSLRCILFPIFLRQTLTFQSDMIQHVNTKNKMSKTLLAFV